MKLILLQCHVPSFSFGISRLTGGTGASVILFLMHSVLLSKISRLIVTGRGQILHISLFFGAFVASM